MGLRDARELIQKALDYDQITEVRHAIRARRDELEKLKKKESGLGLDSYHINERLRIIDGDETKAGLLAIIRPVDAFEDVEGDPAQSDVFFDGGADEVEEDENAGRACLRCGSMEWSRASFDEDEPWCSVCMPIAGEVEEEELEPQRLPDGSLLNEEDEEEEAEGPAPFIPTTAQVEEARVYLSKHGWPAEEDYPPDPLGLTIRFVDVHGWAKAQELAETLDNDQPDPPDVGDMVKMAANRRYVFRVLEVFDDRVAIENAQSQELRPFIEHGALTWDEKGGYWVVENVDPGFFKALEGPDDDYPPDREDDDTVLAQPEQEAEEESGAARIEVGDPVVVRVGELDFEVYQVGAIAVPPPHMTRIVNDQGGDVGKVELGRIRWDQELDAWTVQDSDMAWEGQQTTATIH